MYLFIDFDSANACMSPLKPDLGIPHKSIYYLLPTSELNNLGQKRRSSFWEQMHINTDNAILRR